MSKRSTGSRVVDWALFVWVHGAAALLISVILGWALLDQATLGVIVESVESGVFAANTLLHASGVLGFSALLWGLIYFSFSRARRPRRAGLRGPRALLNQRASVMVETLLVMPVLLLLSFGIAQMALLNVATILSNAATFQASRTAWLWHPETEADRLETRGGLSRPMEWVAESAHIQAAALLAPVAPGDYLEDGYLPPRASKMRGVMLGAQQLVPRHDAGRYTTSLADQLARTHGHAESTNFLASLDTRSFQERSARKFTWAYWFSEVDVSLNNATEEITVHLTYDHMATMPMVAGIFGDWKVAGKNRKGYFTTIRRSFTRRQLDAPRGEWPEGEPVRTNDFY